MRKPVKTASIVLAVIAIFAGLGYGYYRYRFPYGWSHVCDKVLLLALHQYAEQHEGWFPQGQVTPEASLSLLYRQNPNLAYQLRGKTVPLAAALSRFEHGDLLTPETCGWHYVEGLRLDDDSRLAVFWDKAELGHNGQRLGGGGHMVAFIGGHVEHVPGDRWEEFIAEQIRMRAELDRPH